MLEYQTATRRTVGHTHLVLYVLEGEGRATCPEVQCSLPKGETIETGIELWVAFQQGKLRTAALEAFKVSSACPSSSGWAENLCSSHKSLGPVGEDSALLHAESKDAAGH